jgi:hypothetical protein
MSIVEFLAHVVKLSFMDVRGVGKEGKGDEDENKK